MSMEKIPCNLNSIKSKIIYILQGTNDCWTTKLNYTGNYRLQVNNYIHMYKYFYIFYLYTFIYSTWYIIILFTLINPHGGYTPTKFHVAKFQTNKILFQSILTVEPSRMQKKCSRFKFCTQFTQSIQQIIFKSQ